ncbi:50S ribosomal protein L10 [Candidatus Geothermarchaeota archaeon]|nr:MAG: 50S ribosomal protein L10 [Candidatus Geothermarchaeota archaeon]
MSPAKLLSIKRRKIPEWKIKEVEELTKLIREYKIIGIAKLEGVPTAQLQVIRKMLKDKVVLRVTKNTLFRKALEKVKPKNMKELVKYLEGSNIFLFTNMNPFELNMTLEKTKIPRYAKPGDKAEKVIVIPAGDTGLTPGPILSVFGKLRIPTQTREGRIWIARDTVVAKPGDTISPDLASLLRKLDIKPIDVGIELKVVYDNGLIIPGEKLKIDVKEYENLIAEAHSNALKLGTSIAYPESTIIRLSIAKAYNEALVLAAEALIITKETINLIIGKAVAQANALAQILANKVPELGLAPTTKAKEEEKEKEEEKKEEKKEEEEEIAEGLSALFG